MDYFMCLFIFKGVLGMVKVWKDVNEVINDSIDVDEKYRGIKEENKKQKELLSEFDKNDDEKNYQKRKSFFSKIKDLFGEN